MIKVLMVEDNPADVQLVREQIRSGFGSVQFELTSVTRLSEAIQELTAQSFQAILLDLGLPDAIGLDALAPIRHAASDLPIVVLSGLEDEELALAALTHGAQDYLIKKSAHGSVLPRAILYAIERQRCEQSNYRMAHYDGLTDIPNRKLLNDRLNQALSRARRNSQAVGMLFLDIDHFKEINDSLGHSAGDQLLQMVAHRLVTCTRASDTVARLGGDEFALLLPDISRQEDAGHFAEKILHAMEAPFMIEQQELHVSASIGISLFPTDALDTSSLLKTADIAMYCAKQKGRNTFQAYSTRMSIPGPPGMELASSLCYALTREEFVIHFQPLVALRSGAVVGVEALLRWEHPSLGLLPPSRFVPMAEEAGLIVPIGEWVLRRTCQQLRAWRLAGLPALEVAVNLSPHQLTRPGLLKTVTAALNDNDLEPDVLELGLTESAILEDPDTAAGLLRALKQLGVRIALDDFGAGHSSLNRLRQFNFDTLKIDRTFVQRAAGGRTDAALATGIINLAHGLGLNVVAAGVETGEQLAFFRQNDCDQAQGFHLGRPQLAADLELDLRPSRTVLTWEVGGGGLGVNRRC